MSTAASAPVPPPGQASSPPDDAVLELRIHGVSNTPPKAMLDLPESSIEQVEGDDLGSFWRPADHALDKLTEADRGYVPPGITREAYSWGGMARTSIGGTSFVGKILNVAGRFGWSLLLPFGLVNVAYWSRRLGDTTTPLGTDDDANAYDGRGLGLDPLTHRSRRGGAALRLAGLLMTLLTASTAAVVTLDYLGVQCFSSTTARCASLPSWLGFLYGWSLTRRLALLSLLPVALVGFLWWLASRSRTRYEQATRDQTYGTGSDEVRTPDASTANPRWPLLSTPGFWNHSVISGSTATLHLTAVALFITLTSSWHMRFGGSETCRGFQSAVFAAVCRNEASHGSAMAGSPVVIAASLLLLGVVAVLVLVRSDDAADIQGPDVAQLGGLQRGLRHPSTQPIVVIGSGALFVTQLALLYFADTSFPVDVRAAGGRVAMVGLGAAVLVVLALLVGVGLSALTWRHVSAPYPIIAGIVLAVAILASGAFENAALQWTFRVIALFAFVTAIVPVFMDEGFRNPQRRYEMWGGCGPGVLLLLGTALCMAIASAVVVTAGNILNGNYSPASLAGIPGRPSPAVGGGCDVQCDPHVDYALTAPRPYVWFGAVLALAVIVFAVVLLVAVGLQALDSRRTPVAASAAGGEAAVRSGDRSLRGGHPVDSMPRTGPLARAVATARMWARYAHRAEKAVAVLAYLATATLLLAIVASVSTVRAESNAVVSGVMGWGMWALVGVGLGVVALATGSGGSVGQRPLGLLWDLICFLPRAGHPFGPPCYAERVVPELLGRYRWWLTEEGGRTDADCATTSRRIVLAAHSLGSVLAAATLLATPERSGAPAMVPHLSLISYGTQLRAYFSRLFPELLGPEVLGSPPCLAANLTTADPWHSEREDTKPRTTVYAGSVRAHLSGTGIAPGRWHSLWHLTDPLGFPIHHYPPTPADTAFDTYADEVDRTAYLLATLAHSDYPRAAAYTEVLLELAGTQQ